jgi:3-hydroxyisobutyrate dehydrogenase-like beta-hydroxyacid dehydrogenase
MADKEQVGIIGVGRMGQAMTKHLIRHGHNVIANDIEPKACEAARGLGAGILDTPAEVGKVCSFVIIAVGYDDEATAVMLDKDGLLQTMASGSTIAVSSTCTPDHVKQLAEKARERNVEVLDAPICRGQRAADEGTMLTLCGGGAGTFERGKPIYATFCKDIVLLGDVGAGQVGKAMNNFLLWVNGIALIEAGRLSECYGMDLVKLREALLMSSGASDALKNWENVSFLWALKDMQIVMQMADKSGLSLPIAGAVKELVKEGRRSKQTNAPAWTGRKSR